MSKDFRRDFGGVIVNDFRFRTITGFYQRLFPGLVVNVDEELKR